MKKTQEKTILTGLIGSNSVGTSTPESDKDFMSVILADEDKYLGLDWWGDQGTKTYLRKLAGVEVEEVSYELSKFLRLCQNFNPNVIPLLWLDENNYILATPEGRELIKNRDMFNSKLAVNSFSGYALGQLKKMGENCPTGKMGAKRKELRDKFGYDTKYAYHCIRLSTMLVEFLETGELTVYRGGKDADYLLDIRNGKYTYDYVVTEAGKLLQEAETLAKTSNLPDKPDKKRIREFCVKTLREHLELGDLEENEI